jgi:hypothetical protein
MEPHLATYNQLTNSADSKYRLFYESELALPKMRNQCRLEMYGAVYVEVAKKKVANR